jgi:hypothetical protein
VKDIEGPTDTVNIIDLDLDLRAYFTATGTRLGEKLWLRVEARWLASSVPIHVTLSTRGEDADPEILAEWDGTIDDGLWEEEWTVALPTERLDGVQGRIYLSFEVSVEGVDTTASSQTLLLHRTRFSS